MDYIAQYNFTVGIRGFAIEEASEPGRLGVDKKKIPRYHPTTGHLQNTRAVRLLTESTISSRRRRGSPRSSY